MKTTIILFIIALFCCSGFTQDVEDSVVIEGDTIVFGMGENDFANIFPEFEKSENIYSLDLNSSDNSSIRYEVIFDNGILIELAIYTHWPNEGDLRKFDDVAKQFKIVKQEEDEFGLIKYLKKNYIKGYASYGENPMLNVWNSKVVKKEM